jgi:hypothetical protein
MKSYFLEVAIKLANTDGIFDSGEDEHWSWERARNAGLLATQQIPFTTIQSGLKKDTYKVLVDERDIWVTAAAIDERAADPTKSTHPRSSTTARSTTSTTAMRSTTSANADTTTNDHGDHDNADNDNGDDDA